ncbi:MAG: hypothetical protein ABIA59_11035 [Candidatus Latescibacterota bacterium]
MVFVTAAAVVIGCAASNGIQPVSQNPSNGSLLESTCADNLAYLNIIINGFSAQKGMSNPRLVEAQEIYHLAEILYLQKEYSLAIELIEDAVQLLKEPGD